MKWSHRRWQTEPMLRVGGSRRSRGEERDAQLATASVLPVGLECRL